MNFQIIVSCVTCHRPSKWFSVFKYITEPGPRIRLYLFMWSVEEKMGKNQMCGVALVRVTISVAIFQSSITCKIDQNETTKYSLHP